MKKVIDPIPRKKILKELNENTFVRNFHHSNILHKTSYLFTLIIMMFKN